MALFLLQLSHATQVRAMSTPVYNCTEPGGDHLSSQDRADPCSVPTGFGMTTPATVGGKAFLIAYGLFGCAGTILFFNLFLELEDF